MSRYEDMRYEMARRRRELAENRVRETTQGFVDRYNRVLADLQTEGLDEFVSEEFSALQAAVRRVERLQQSDAFAARDLSNEISARVYGLPRLARGLRTAGERAQREAERLEQQRLDKAREELEHAWQESLLSWRDPLVRQLARPELANIRNRLMGADSTTSIAVLRQALESAHAQFTKEAAVLREQQSRQADGEAAREMLAECRSRVAQAGPAAQALSQTIENAAGLDDDSLKQQLREVNARLDEMVVDEACRREVVRAVYQSMTQAGFTVAPPKHDKTQGKDEVIVTGRRPAGSTAVFRIELDGRLNYKFENYRGSACRTDIDRVLPTLQSVYGISLSDPVVHWVNPDDEGRDARPQPEQARGK